MKTHIFKNALTRAVAVVSAESIREAFELLTQDKASGGNIVPIVVDPTTIPFIDLKGNTIETRYEAFLRALHETGLVHPVTGWLICPVYVPYDTGAFFIASSEAAVVSHSWPWGESNLRQFLAAPNS